MNKNCNTCIHSKSIMGDFSPKTWCWVNRLLTDPNKICEYYDEL